MGKKATASPSDSPSDTPSDAPETLIFVRTHSDSYWSQWEAPLDTVVEAMQERRKGEYVRTPPTEILEVTVTRRVYVGARVYVADGADAAT